MVNKFEYNETKKFLWMNPLIGLSKILVIIICMLLLFNTALSLKQGNPLHIHKNQGHLCNLCPCKNRNKNWLLHSINKKCLFNETELLTPISKQSLSLSTLLYRTITLELPGSLVEFIGVPTCVMRLQRCNKLWWLISKVNFWFYVFNEWLSEWDCLVS